MRSSILRTVLGAALVMLAAGSARAAEPVAVKIPFAFTVEGHALPAGEYRVERPFNDQAVLILRAAEPGQEAIIVRVQSADALSSLAGEAPVLTFSRTANGYVLASSR